MKLKFWIDNGANIHSLREHILDVTETGYTEEEWKALTDDEKFQEAVDYWAGMGSPEIGVDEIPD